MPRRFWPMGMRTFPRAYKHPGVFIFQISGDPSGCIAFEPANGPALKKPAQAGRKSLPEKIRMIMLILHRIIGHQHNTIHIKYHRRAGRFYCLV